MKKALSIVTLVLVTILSTGFKPVENNKKANDPKYYVAYAKENYANGKWSYAVTNVVYVDCEFFGPTTVTNQLYTYYNAYYKKSRNTISFGGRGDILAFEFDTKSEAESKRRELIAKFNGNNDILVIENFSVSCED